MLTESACSSFIKLVDVIEKQFAYITNQKNTLILKTNAEADRYRIVSIDLSR